MHIIAVILARSVLVLIGVIQIAMLLRALLSFLYMEDDNRFLFFLVLLTEPVILPVRALLSRFRFVENSPLDIPFFVTVLLLAAISALLPTVA